MAVSLAASYHGVEGGELRYRVVDKRHGFLKTRRRVVIEVDAEAPRQDVVEEPREAPAALEALPPVAPAALEALPPVERKERVRVEEDELDREGRYLVMASELLLGFTGVDAAVQVERDDESFWLNLVGEGEGRLLADGASLLSALDVLVPRLTRGLGGGSVSARLDCRGVRQERDEKLGEAARASAYEVLRSGRSTMLEPMNAADRRLAHRAIASVSGVETQSEGTGLSRRIRIRRT